MALLFLRFAWITWINGLVRMNFSDTHALHCLGVILAVEDVPLLAAFEDFLLLRRNLSAHFCVDLLFLFQQRCEDIDDFQPDCVAVLDKIHVGIRDQRIDHSVRQSDSFFAAQSHISVGSASFRGRAGLSLSCTSPDRKLPCAASLPDSAPESRELPRSTGLRSSLRPPSLVAPAAQDFPRFSSRSSSRPRGASPLPWPYGLHSPAIKASRLARNLY